MESKRAGREPSSDAEKAPEDGPQDVPSLGDELRTAAQYGMAGKWATKRRAKIHRELERNRRGEYKIPTWVLAVVLVAFVAGWVLLIVLA